MSFLLIKALLGKFIDFFVAHWRVICIALMLCAIFYYKTRYDSAVQALAVYKADIAVAVAKQDAENAIKHQIATNVVNQAVSDAALSMSQLNLNRDKSSHDMKALYEKQNNPNRPQSNLANTSVVRGAGNDSIAPIDIASDSEVIAESGGERYTAAYRTLESGCAITTIDYNTLRTWADTVCEIATCQ